MCWEPVSSGVARPKSSVLNATNLTLTLIAISLWALSFPFIKIALEDFPPLTLAAVRFAIATPFFIALLFLLGGGLDSLRRLTRRQWFLLVLWGLFSTTIANIAQNIGMQWTSASVTSIIQSSGPILAALLAIMLLGERYTHLKLAGGVVAVIGTVGIVTGGGLELGGMSLVGNLLIVGSELSYVAGGIVAKHVLRDVNPYTMMAVGVPVATVPLAIGAAFEDPVGSIAGASSTAWGSVVFLAIGPTIAAMTLFYIVLKRVELSRLVYFVYLIPVVAVAASVLMLGETITLVQALFAAMIIGGVAAAQREEPEPSPPIGPGIAGEMTASPVEGVGDDDQEG
jgi:drug/metabolite transporter (DMT)-like permease